MLNETRGLVHLRFWCAATWVKQVAASAVPTTASAVQESISITTTCPNKAQLATQMYWQAQNTAWSKRTQEPRLVGHGGCQHNGGAEGELKAYIKQHSGDSGQAPWRSKQLAARTLGNHRHPGYLSAVILVVVQALHDQRGQRKQPLVVGNATDANNECRAREWMP